MRIKITAPRLLLLASVLVLGGEATELPTIDPWAALQGRPVNGTLEYVAAWNLAGRSIVWQHVASDLMWPALIIAALYLFWRLLKPRLPFFRREWRRLGAVAYLLMAFFFLVNVPYSYTDYFYSRTQRVEYVHYDFLWNVNLPSVLYGRIILTQLALLAGFGGGYLLLKTLPSKRQVDPAYGRIR